MKWMKCNLDSVLLSTVPEYHSESGLRTGHFSPAQTKAHFHVTARPDNQMRAAIARRIEHRPFPLTDHQGPVAHAHTCCHVQKAEGLRAAHFAHRPVFARACP